MPHATDVDIITLSGVVSAVNLEPGQGMPSITLGSGSIAVTILIGPHRLLLDNKFEIKLDQFLEVKAFKDPRTGNAFVATEIKDTKSGTTLVLRNASGIPHITGGPGGMRHGGPGLGVQGSGAMGRGRGMVHDPGDTRGARGCADCSNLDLSKKTTLVGTVQIVEMAAGQGYPNFTLLLADKSTVTVVTGPFWALQQANFTIAKGDSLSVVAYPSLQHEGAYVAAEIKNEKTGQNVVLRGENGAPLMPSGRGAMRMIHR